MYDEIFNTSRYDLLKITYHSCILRASTRHLARKSGSLRKMGKASALKGNRVRSNITILNQECIQVVSWLSDLREICQHFVDHVPILQKMVISTTFIMNQGIHLQVTVIQNLMGTLAVGNCHYNTSCLFIKEDHNQ